MFAAGRVAADETGRLFIRHRADPYEISDETESSLAEVSAGPAAAPARSSRPSVARMRERSDRMPSAGSTFSQRAAARERWEESSTTVGRWSHRVHGDSRFVEVLDPDHLIEDLLSTPAPIWTGLIGTIGQNAIDGREPPVITLQGLAPYPRANRDGWDELVLDSTAHSIGATTIRGSATHPSDFLVVEGTPSFHGTGLSGEVGPRPPWEKADLDLAWAAHLAIEAEPLWEGVLGSGSGLVEGRGLTVHLTVPLVTDAMRNWLLVSEHLICVRPIVQRPVDRRSWTHAAEML